MLTVKPLVCVCVCVRIIGCSEKFFLEFQKSSFLICGKWAKNDTENGFGVFLPDGLETGPNILLN